jgi:hypothetical protein
MAPRDGAHSGGIAAGVGVYRTGGRAIWNSYAASPPSNSNSYARRASNAGAASAAAYWIDMSSLFFLGLGLSGVVLLLAYARSNKRRQRRFRARIDAR